MPLDPVKIAVAVEGGLSSICATCERFWDAADKGASSCGQVCGGPVSGGDFPRYKGPIVDFSRGCFVCGDAPSHAVKGNKSLRVFGCCTAHLVVVKNMKPDNRDAVDVVILSKDGSRGSNDSPPEPGRIKLVLG